jgi:hypothetical protein
MKHILIAISLLLTTSIYGASDVIVFKNGDILTGKILKQDAERVYFKSSSFSSVSLDVDDIAEIRFKAGELGEVAVPTEVIASQKPSQPAPKVAEKKPAAVKPAKIAKKKSPWSGQAGMSVALRESNTLRRSGNSLVEKNEEFESYRVYGNVNWKGDRNNLKWNWTYRYSKTDIRKNDDYLNVTQNYKHDFTDNFFARAKTMYQQDFRRGIDNEYLQTAEIGINWLDSKKLKFNTSVGGGYHEYDRTQEKYSEAKGKFILDESLRWTIVNSLTLFQKYTHLGNLKDYHFVFNSGLENKLIQDVFLRLEYRIDRDTEVNYNDKSYYDKALLTSVLYKF